MVAGLVLPRWRMMSRVLQHFQNGKPGIGSYHIAEHLRRIGFAEFIQMQRSSLLKLKAGKCVTRLHCRIVGLLRNESVISQVSDYADSVGKPTKFYVCPHWKIFCIYGIGFKQLRFGRFCTKIFAEFIPTVVSYKSGKDIKGA